MSKNSKCYMLSTKSNLNQQKFEYLNKENNNKNMFNKSLKLNISNKNSNSKNINIFNNKNYSINNNNIINYDKKTKFISIKCVINDNNLINNDNNFNDKLCGFIDNIQNKISMNSMYINNAIKCSKFSLDNNYINNINSSTSSNLNDLSNSKLIKSNNTNISLINNKFDSKRNLNFYINDIVHEKQKCYDVYKNLKKNLNKKNNISYKSGSFNIPLYINLKSKNSCYNNLNNLP